MEILSSEFEISTEQVTFLENYLMLEQTLKAKNATKEVIASEQVKMAGQLEKLFPKEVVTEVQNLLKKGTPNLTNKDVGKQKTF